MNEYIVSRFVKIKHLPILFMRSEFKLTKLDDALLKQNLFVGDVCEHVTNNKEEN